MIIPGFQWFKRLLVCDGVFTMQSHDGKRIEVADTHNGRALFSEVYEPFGWIIVPTVHQEAPERKQPFVSIFKPRHQMMPLDSGSA